MFFSFLLCTYTWINSITATFLAKFFFNLLWNFMYIVLWFVADAGTSQKIWKTSMLDGIFVKDTTSHYSLDWEWYVSPSCAPIWASLWLRSRLLKPIRLEFRLLIIFVTLLLYLNIILKFSRIISGCRDHNSIGRQRKEVSSWPPSSMVQFQWFLSAEF